MAITKSAKKAIRNSARKHVFNLRRNREIETVEKQISRAIVSGKITEAEKLLPLAYKKIDKASKMGTLKKNTASRQKSRLVAKILRAKK